VGPFAAFSAKTSTRTQGDGAAFIGEPAPVRVDDTEDHSIDE